MAKKSDGIDLYDHPLYRAFAMLFASPIVATIKGELILFPDAATYWLFGASTNKKFREKVKTATNGFKILTYWATEKGLKSIGADFADEWENKKEDRFISALKKKFEQNSGLKDILLAWNPAKEVLADKYAREENPDLIAALIKVRKELKGKE